VAVSAALGLLLLAFADRRWARHSLDPWLSILVLGTLLGQTSVAALWCALGPCSLARRLPLAAIWLATIVLAFGSNRSMNVGSPEVDPVSTTGVVVLVQWALIALPLWILADWRRLRIGHAATGRLLAPPNNRQLGIRETMIITAAVAAVLGGSTFHADQQLSINWPAAREFGFLALAGIILALPWGVQMLLLQKRCQAVSAVVLIVLLTSAVDVVLAAFMLPGSIDAQLCWAVSVLNLVQTAWLIATLAILKLGGYEIVRGNSF
jgi:hypothetical protein